ncbi:MAG: nucleoside deaminase [Bacilli bacterium]|nr:nucleoside deaminase [Bacilli bacterium]
MNKYIDVLIELAKSAEQVGDIPIGAIVVKNNEIIGEGFNNRIITNDPTGHAEVNAIKDACNKLGDWRLSDCDLYVTLEPCDMCMEIIQESRIQNVYYLLENKEKHKYKRTNVYILNDVDNYKEKYKEKLSNFFDKNLNR